MYTFAQIICALTVIVYGLTIFVSNMTVFVLDLTVFSPKITDMCPVATVGSWEAKLTILETQENPSSLCLLSTHHFKNNIK